MGETFKKHINFSLAFGTTLLFPALRELSAKPLSANLALPSRVPICYSVSLVWERTWPILKEKWGGGGEGSRVWGQELHSECILALTGEARNVPSMFKGLGGA